MFAGASSLPRDLVFHLPTRSARASGWKHEERSRQRIGGHGFWHGAECEKDSHLTATNASSRLSLRSGDDEPLPGPRVGPRDVRPDVADPLFPRDAIGMALTSHIFREYDIRGIVGADLGPDISEEIGRAYGSFVREETGRERARVVVGQDNRPSSPSLAEALVRGIRAAGVDVLDIGTVPTPMVYWAEATRRADGGVQVTGSHNPAEWNGIKMTVGGRAIYGDAIQALRQRIEVGTRGAGHGGCQSEDVSAPYVADLAGRFPPLSSC